MSMNGEIGATGEPSAPRRPRVRLGPSWAEGRRPRARRRGFVAVEFGHRFLGAVVIHQGFASAGGGDERGDGGVVEGAR